MKKVLIGSIAGVLIAMSACASDKNEIPEQEIEVKEGTHIYDGFSLGTEVIHEDGKVYLDINLENKNDSAVPLHYANYRLLNIRVVDEKGEEVYTKTVNEDKRRVLQPMEKITWGSAFAVKTKGKHDVKVELLLKDHDGEGYSYKKELLTTNSSFMVNDEEKVISGTYLPKGEQRLMYAGPSNEEVVMTEAFVYFDDNGFAQSENTMSGTNVYLSNEEGLYLIDIEGQTLEDNLIESVNDNSRDLLLKYPVKSGEKWSSGGNEYQIVSVDETVETGVKTYNNAVKVKQTNGNNIIFFYYHKDIGLLKVQAEVNDRLRTQFVLHSIQ